MVNVLKRNKSSKGFKRKEGLYHSELSNKLISMNIVTVVKIGTIYNWGKQGEVYLQLGHLETFAEHLAEQWTDKCRSRLH